MTIAMVPPMIWAPKIVAIPVVDAMSCIVARYAKLTPMIRGSLAPQKRVMPKSCRSVESAAQTSED